MKTPDNQFQSDNQAELFDTAEQQAKSNTIAQLSAATTLFALSTVATADHSNSPQQNAAQTPTQPTPDFARRAEQIIGLPEINAGFAKEGIQVAQSTETANDASPETLSISQAVAEVLNHEKYTAGSKEFKEWPYGRSNLTVDGQRTTRLGLPMGITDAERSQLIDARNGDNHRRNGMEELRKLVAEGGFSAAEQTEVIEAYQNFASQLLKTYSLINSTYPTGLFINKRLKDNIDSYANKDEIQARWAGTAYNRLIAIGMTQGWTKAEFQQATQALADTLTGTPLPKKLQGKNGFFDGKGQWGNIDDFTEYINSHEVREEGYKDGKTPLERAKKSFPKSLLKQFLYAQNINHADLLRTTRENIQKGKLDVEKKYVQKASGIFYRMFPQSKFLQKKYFSM